MVSRVLVNSDVISLVKVDFNCIEDDVVILSVLSSVVTSFRG